MKTILLSLTFLLISCSVEQRIKEYSYTEEWYYLKGVRYQVYQTKHKRKYVIVFNKSQTNFKRLYIDEK